MGSWMVKMSLPQDPTETVDTDGDGIGDNTDTDDDGDGIEDAIETEKGTDQRSDTDEDGLNDFTEEELGTDPLKKIQITMVSVMVKKMKSKQTLSMKTQMEMVPLMVKTSYH